MLEPSIPLSGRIRDVRLPTLLQFLRRERKTGVLKIWRNDLDKSIYFKEGDIVFAASHYPDDRLGEVFLKTGKIHFSQYERSVELLKKTGKRQGTILVEEGFIQPKDLFEGVVLQVKEIILSLFTWIDGEYAFTEGPLPSEEVITLNISTADLILDGIKRIQDWSRLIKELPPLDSALQIANDPRDLFQTMNLSRLEREVVQFVDGRRTLREILLTSSMPSMECVKILYFLLVAGVIRVAPSVSTKEAPREKAEAPSFASETEKENIEKEEEIEALKKAFLGKERESTYQKIREASLSMGKQNHYQVLHIPQTATREEIKKAYFKLAKEYHPDRHFESGMEEVKKELEALFIRITAAYDTLVMESKRRAYDAALASGKYTEKESAAPSPREFYIRGEEALRQGDLRNASYFLEMAIEGASEGPEKAAYYLRYGQALARIPGKLRDAAEALRRGMALDPSSVALYVELGMIYQKTGLTQKALATFSEALKRDPDNKVAKTQIEKLQS